MEKTTFTRQEKIEFAQRMANNPTPAESVLYSALSTAHIKFKKQYIVSGFILDAYLPDLGIGIECDGGYHNTISQKIYDRDRDCAIKKCGIKVLRFTNDEIMSNPMGVVSKFRRSEKLPKRKRQQTKHKKAERIVDPVEAIKKKARSMADEFDCMSRLPSSKFLNVKGITGKTRNKKRGARSA